MPKLTVVPMLTPEEFEAAALPKLEAWNLKMQERVTGQTLGTLWVGKGQGSTWRELASAFGQTLVPPNLILMIYGEAWQDSRTNLKLTGAAITDYDRKRWESGQVE